MSLFGPCEQSCSKSAEESSSSKLEAFMKPLREERDRELRSRREAREAECRKYLGPLLVEKLPGDAWEKWCKDGVVCFSLSGPHVLKIYFFNPSDRSAYHVVDFHYSKFGNDDDYFHPASHMSEVSCILVGSRIYVLGGCYGWNDGPVAVYYCDVANQLPGPDGGYEWKDGPKLNSYKPDPFVFSLAGSIYVLYVGRNNDHICAPFEVLKPDSHEWETLAVPQDLTLNDKVEAVSVLGSFVYEDAKMIFIYVSCEFGDVANYLFIYDTEHDRWNQVETPFGNISPSLGMTESFFLYGSSDFRLLNHLDLDDTAASLLLDGGELPYCWQLFSLEKGKRFCFLALYRNGDMRALRCNARVCTFDWVERPSDVSDANAMRASVLPDAMRASVEPDAKRSKLPRYTVANTKIEEIVFAYDLVLIPRQHGSKV